MPVYEYKCPECGEKFEVKAGFFHSLDKVKCPKCGRNKPERVFSVFNTGTSSGNSCSPRGFG
jgi:putative FmdB family regulatory protein